MFDFYTFLRVSAIVPRPSPLAPHPSPVFIYSWCTCRCSIRLTAALIKCYKAISGNRRMNSLSEPSSSVLQPGKKASDLYNGESHVNLPWWQKLRSESHTKVPGCETMFWLHTLSWRRYTYITEGCGTSDRLIAAIDESGVAASASYKCESGKSVIIIIIIIIYKSKVNKRK